MTFLPPRFYSALLRAPWSAVVAALAVRATVLVLSIEHTDFEEHHYHAQGREALVIAYSLVTGHGLSFPVPYDIPTAWVAPTYVLAALSWCSFVSFRSQSRRSFRANLQFVLLGAHLLPNFLAH